MILFVCFSRVTTTPPPTPITSIHWWSSWLTKNWQSSNGWRPCKNFQRSSLMSWTVFNDYPAHRIIKKNIEAGNGYQPGENKTNISVTPSENLSTILAYRRQRSLFLSENRLNSSSIDGGKPAAENIVYLQDWVRWRPKLNSSRERSQKNSPSDEKRIWMNVMLAFFRSQSATFDQVLVI